MTNNGFDAWGRLKLIGQYASIFSNAGPLIQEGRPTFNIIYDYTPEGHTPWSLVDRNGVGACFLRGYTNSTQNFDFPSVGSSFCIPYDGTNVSQPWFDSLPYVSDVTPGGSMNPVKGSTPVLTPVNGTVSREASLLFPANNPSVNNAPIAGIFILPFTSFVSSFELTTPGIPSSDRRGCALGQLAWYWQFTDETFQNKRSAYKDRNYGLSISFRQTIARG